jgi:hypothetical protein
MGRLGREGTTYSFFSFLDQFLSFSNLVIAGLACHEPLDPILQQCVHCTAPLTCQAQKEKLTTKNKHFTNNNNNNNSIFFSFVLCKHVL